MKELTIEQKALAYDEALDIAKHYHSGMGDDVKCVLEEVFSELRESEDEKIRKTLINMFEKYHIYKVGDFTNKEIIAWLEKQGEPKPADKVEPKFKVGDWVVTSYGKVNQIICVDEDGDGYTLDDETYFSGSWKDMYHLWTIQDAKPGDVLACGNDIVIFKENNYNPKDNSGCMFVYCSCNNFYEIGGINPTDYKPATKEQCDLLFAKMYEARYEWDVEKKELKKVGQEFTELAKGEDYGIDGLYAAIDILQKALGKVDGYQTDDGILEHACAISAVKELYEQKHAWSERVQPQSKQEWKQENTGDLTDFENVMMHIGDSFFGQHAGLDPNNTNAIKEQANLLLELVSSKEWSEKDNRLLNDAISLADECDDFELRDWLKSLKPQNRWKPSDEQMSLLEELVEDNNQRYFYTILRSLYEQLKKLREE